MIFRKKKRMIDVRDLQKRGVVRIPKQETVVPTNQEGFVDFVGSKDNDSFSKSQTNAQFFGFGSNDKRQETSPNSPLNFLDSPPKETFSTEEDGYNKREVDEKIINLDNKIYKLEQRVELLEKKLDITNNSNNSVGPMGW